MPMRAKISGVCSPNLGAGRRSAPGVIDSRGSTLCMVKLPSSSSGNIDNHLALLNVAIGNELVDVIDGCRGNLGVFKSGQAVDEVASGDKLADRPLRFLVVGKSRAVAGKAGIFRHFGDTHGRIQPFRHRLHRARDRNQRPSRVRYTLRGLVMFERLPCRLGTMPKALNAAASEPTTECIASSSDRSMT